MTRTKTKKGKWKLLSADEIINEISEVLAQSDGDFIENIANQVLVSKVTYDGDSLFMQEPFNLNYEKLRNNQRMVIRVFK